MQKGDDVHAKCLLIVEHHGTHVDAPGHLVKDGGDAWIHNLPIEQFIGPARVVRARDKGPDGELSRTDLLAWEEQHGPLEEGDIVLFDFGWDRLWTTPFPAQSHPDRPQYYRNWPGLITNAAEVLQERRVKLIGTDAPSIDAYPYAGPPGADAEPCHPILQLGAVKIIIAEGLENLASLPDEGAFFVGLPLRIRDGSGSPVRAVAFVPK